MRNHYKEREIKSLLLCLLVLDENGELLYASNNKSFELTAEVMNKNFVIKAVDAEGNLYDVPKVDGGSVNITLTEAGTLCEQLNTLIVKAKISGPLNGSDVKCLRQKINQESLTYLDLSEATFVSGGDSYYNGYNTTEGKIGYDMFAYCTKLTHLVLPNEVERINSRACQYSGLTNVVIPDSVAFVESYAFDNSFNMRTATIGEGVTSLGWGSFGGTKLKNIYVKPLTPPSLADYVFSTDSASLFIHVYKEAYEDYVASKWSKYGVIVADLDELEKHDTIIDIDEVACDELLKNVEVMSWGGTLVDVPIHDKNGEEISIKFYDSANTLQAAYPDYAETQLMNGPIGEEDAYVHLCASTRLLAFLMARNTELRLWSVTRIVMLDSLWRKVSTLPARLGLLKTRVSDTLALHRAKFTLSSFLIQTAMLKSAITLLRADRVVLSL